MNSMFRHVCQWGELVKFSHSVFALPFALTATFLAGRNIEGRGWPHLGQLALILTCLVAARSAAMTFNRIIDVGFDARNPRTSGRPLPSGRISVGAAWVMLAASGLAFGFGAIGFDLLYSNSWPILLSGPVLAALCAYSLTKRFTPYSHIFLGGALALSPAAAWLAIDPASMGWPVVLLSSAVACWVAGFDMMYACQDIDVDRSEGLHSLPSRFGAARALQIAKVMHIVAIGLLIALGLTTELGVVYAVGVGIAAVVLWIEHALVKADDLKHINVAFFTLNGVVSLILGTAAIVDILHSGKALGG